MSNRLTDTKLDELARLEREHLKLVAQTLDDLSDERLTLRTALRDALTWMGQRTDDTEERRRIIAAGWAALEGR